jgi:hypothetical protein
VRCRESRYVVKYLEYLGSFGDTTRRRCEKCGHSLKYDATAWWTPGPIWRGKRLEVSHHGDDDFRDHGTGPCRV